MPDDDNATKRCKKIKKIIKSKFKIKENILKKIKKESKDHAKTFLKPIISSYSKTRTMVCMRLLSCLVLQHSVFKNKTLEKLHTGHCTRLWMTRNSGLKIFRRDSKKNKKEPNGNPMGIQWKPHIFYNEIYLNIYFIYWIKPNFSLYPVIKWSDLLCDSGGWA